MGEEAKIIRQKGSSFLHRLRYKPTNQTQLDASLGELFGIHRMSDSDVLQPLNRIQSIT